MDPRVACLLVALIGCTNCSDPATDASPPQWAPKTPADDAEGDAEAYLRCDPRHAVHARCIIKTLEGRAQSDGELMALIEAHASTGDTRAAMDLARTFARRYPDHPRRWRVLRMLLPRD